MALKLRKLSYALGAEVCDFNVAAPMSEAQFGEIYQAFLDNGILLFRDQDITPAQQISSIMGKGHRSSLVSAS